MTNHRKIVLVLVLRGCSGDKWIQGSGGTDSTRDKRNEQIRRSEERKGFLAYQQQWGKANPSPGWAAVATTRRGKGAERTETKGKRSG